MDSLVKVLASCIAEADTIIQIQLLGLLRHDDLDRVLEDLDVHRPIHDLLDVIEVRVVSR